MSLINFSRTFKSQPRDRKQSLPLQDSEKLQVLLSATNSIAKAREFVPAFPSTDWVQQSQVKAWARGTCAQRKYSKKAEE